MATEDREMMEARGAGESGPNFPKMVPGDPVSEGKPRAILVRGCLTSLSQSVPSGGGRVLWGHVTGPECYEIPDSS